MNREWFDQQLSRLFVLRGVPENSDGHWAVMQDVPADVIESGIAQALKTRVWFPVPAELRMDCDAVTPRRPQAVHPTSFMVPLEGSHTVHIPNPFGGEGITVAVGSEPYRECAQCDDTGMEKFWCGPSASSRWPWLELRRCDKRHAHADHDWAAACPCVPRNSVIQRRREAMGLRYSQSPEKVA
jgi:hypothetical protein